MSEPDENKPKRLTPTQKIEALKNEFYTHADSAQTQIKVLRINQGDLQDNLESNINGLKLGTYAALALSGLALLVALVW